MNPELLRAFVLRGLVGVAVLVSVFLFTLIGKSPVAPWLVAILFAPFVAFGVISLTLGDRKLAVRCGRENAPWNGSNSRWCQFNSSTRPAAAPSIAATAISEVGGRQVQIVHGSVAVGWIGSSWTNIPQFQEYQLSIVTAPNDSGGSTFTCCARPRWNSAKFGTSRSRSLSDALDSEVQRLTHGSW